MNIIKVDKIKNERKINNNEPKKRGILIFSSLSVIGSKKYANKNPNIIGWKISLKKQKIKPKIDIENKPDTKIFKELFNFSTFPIFILKKIVLLKFFLGDHDLYQIVTYNIHHPHSRS